MNDERQFAIDVVRTLVKSGYQALWAGGCVRDQLLGVAPKDYDVATNATPDQIRDLFGRKRTLPIGAAFGVITVVGNKSQGQIEVATFRKDGGYSDGRRPDAVSFSSAEEDAQRRDFTINGLFFDPLNEQILDFVGGQEDLAKQVIRAIGDPHERLDEDKLRMLRAVRFAATYGFELDKETESAVVQHADEIRVVSVERISAELRRMLVHKNRRLAGELLRKTKLLSVILPEFTQTLLEETWNDTLATLDFLSEPSFATAFAVVVRSICDAAESSVEMVNTICRRMKLSNEEISSAEFQLQQYPLVLAGVEAPWPQLQRVLIDDRGGELITFCRALSQQLGRGADGVQFCAAKLALPAAELNPSRLLDGNDLQDAGIPSGPHYKRLIDSIRDEQLMGRLNSSEEALVFAQAHWDKLNSGGE